MGTITLLFAAVAVAAGLIQTLSHIGGSKYVFGNSHFFGIVLELMVLFTTLLTGGTVSGFLINTLAGLLVYAILELGASWKGGTKIHFSLKDIKNGSFGFSTSKVEPTMSSEKLGSMAVDAAIKFVKGVSAFFVSVVDTIARKVNNAASAA